MGEPTWDTWPQDNTATWSSRFCCLFKVFIDSTRTENSALLIITWRNIALNSWNGSIIPTDYRQSWYGRTNCSSRGLLQTTSMFASLFVVWWRLFSSFRTHFAALFPLIFRIIAIGNCVGFPRNPKSVLVLWVVDILLDLRIAHVICAQRAPFRLWLTPLQIKAKPVTITASSKPLRKCFVKMFLFWTLQLFKTNCY